MFFKKLVKNLDAQQSVDDRVTSYNHHMIVVLANEDLRIKDELVVHSTLEGTPNEQHLLTKRLMM